jgi:serine/threonine-protein kinase
MTDRPNRTDPVTGPAQTGTDDLEPELAVSDLVSTGSDPERTELRGTSVGTAAAAVVGPGSVLDGRYQIEAILGQGGSGTVVRAWDRVLSELVALKILHPARAAETSWIRRLAREVKVARAIRHPNVCRVFDLGNADGQWFVTMELATGGSLRERLQTGGGASRPIAERLADARALCAGLAAIHAVGIIHRDVTPQNVLCMADGRLVLSDFGLAIGTTDNTTVHGGTPSYMAPETLMGERADLRSDVWQLGAILHEVLFGRRPEWERGPDGLAMKWPLGAEATPVEEELARLCADCLAQNPAGRPATAMAVAGRLAAAEAARPRTGLERATLRAKSLARRHRRVVMAAAGLAAMLGVARAVQVAARPPLCRAAAQKLDGIWDMQAKAVARRAFSHSGKGYAADTFWSVNRVLEGYLEAWKNMYTEACEATHVRGEQSAEVLDLRMACLNERLTGVRALSQLFGRADAEIVDNAVKAAHSLGTLERCADQRLLRAVVPLPEDAGVRTQVDRVRRDLAEAKALHDAGDIKAAAARAAASVEAARGVGYAPVLAEGLELLGKIDVDFGDNSGAQSALKAAVAQAEASRDDELKAEAEAWLLAALGRSGHFSEADDWATQARATLARIGGHDRTRGLLEINVAVVEEARSHYEEAIAHERLAVQLRERSGESRIEVARDLNNIAVSLNELGRPQEAIDYIQRSIAELRRELGADHPLVGTFVSNEGEILARLGRGREAHEAFTSALTVEERGYGKEGPNLAYPLVGLGEGYLTEGKPALAIAPLERALRICEAHDSDQRLVAQATFALARALWDANQERARAARLAERAREIYARQPAEKAHAAEVERWAAVHQGG